MERHYFGLSTLLASVALLIWSIGETFAFPQGPNVSMGSNPIVTLDCGSSNTTSTDVGGYPSYSNPYEVPAGFDYIITDFGLTSNNSYIEVDNGNGYQRIYSHYFPPTGQKTQVSSLQTGMKVPSTAFVRCQSNGHGFASGYLAHQ